MSQPPTDPLVTALRNIRDLVPGESEDPDRDLSRMQDIADKALKDNENEPNWREIALKLGNKVLFAVDNLSVKGGTGMTVREMPDGSIQTGHWRASFCDALELLPGVTMDREAVFALDLPAKARAKFFKARAAEAERKEAEDGGK